MSKTGFDVDLLACLICRRVTNHKNKIILRLWDLHHLFGVDFAAFFGRELGGAAELEDPLPLFAR